MQKLSVFRLCALAAGVIGVMFFSPPAFSRNPSPTPADTAGPALPAIVDSPLGVAKSAPATITTIIGHDTLKMQDTVTIPSVGPIIPANHIGPVPLPSIVQIIAVILAMLLPTVQAILKAIPTPRSVLIQGWVGKILNWLTWFVDDASDTPGVPHPKS